MDIRRTIIGAMLAIGATAIPVAGQAARYAVDIEVAPPPDRVERVPAPRQGYIWAPGYYRWDHGRHVWTGRPLDTRAAWASVGAASLGAARRAVAFRRRALGLTKAARPRSFLSRRSRAARPAQFRSRRPGSFGSSPVFAIPGSFLSTAMTKVRGERHGYTISEVAPRRGAYKAKAGWDPCTGLGSPDGEALRKAL